MLDRKTSLYDTTIVYLYPRHKFTIPDNHHYTHCPISHYSERNVPFFSSHSGSGPNPGYGPMSGWSYISGNKLTTHLHLVPGLRMRGATSPISHTSSLRVVCSSMWTTLPRFSNRILNRNKNKLYEITVRRKVTESLKGD